MITTTSNTHFIEAEQYSQFILENMKDGLLPTNFYRDVSDFGNGTVLNIKTIGEAQIQEIEEDSPIFYSPIESGNVQLRITDYVGDGWYVTDVMRQDGAQIEQLLAARAREATRAIQENFETRALATLNAAQTPNAANAINGFAHRRLASGPNNTVALADLIQLKLAFDKAEIPYAGRIAIVDPVVGATLSSLFQATVHVDSNPMMQEILNGGFSRDHEYIMNLFGWSIISSNRLPTIAASTEFAFASEGKANLFLNIADDQTKALMVAWRQQPKVESERNKDKQRDEFVQTARYGLGVQRVDTLAVLISNATAIN